MISQRKVNDITLHSCSNLLKSDYDGNMFSERLQDLMDALEVNASTLSSYCEMDRTGISRMKSGAAVPKKNGSAAAKLAVGLRCYATETDRLDKLCTLIDCKTDVPLQTIDSTILTFLYQDEYSSDDVAGIENASSMPFAERLDLALNLSGLTNAELALLIHVDASQISRYRNGKRTIVHPKRTSFYHILPEVLLSRIEKSNGLEALSAFMGTGAADINTNSFLQWLYANDTSSTSDIAFASGLIDLFNVYDEIPADHLPSPDSLNLREYLDNNTTEYHGTSGLRDAVNRFLVNVMQSKDATELLLYSDQPMDWMVSDEDFRMKWALLMHLCVHNGTRITIIHNINRSLTEMSDAITNWLPLYMTGMVRSYYNKWKENSRFSHTIFLCRGRAGICGFSAKGSEDSCQYQYLTTTTALDAARQSFDALLEASGQLMIPLAYAEGESLPTDATPYTVLPDMPNVRIIISDSLVQVIPLKQPQIALCFSHPDMCRAFMHYSTNENQQ